MRQLLVVLTLAFSLGIILAGKIKIPFLVIYSLTSIFFIGALFTQKRRLGFEISLILVFLFLGAARLKDIQALPRGHISHYAYYKNNRLYAVKGFITSEPVFKINKTSFVLRAEEVSFHNLKTKTCGDTLTYIRGRAGLKFGDALIVRGSLYRPFKSPGQNNYRNYLANQGVYSILNAAYFIKLNFPKTQGLEGFALSLKNKIEEVIFRYLSPISASILEAMILGEKKNIPPLVYQAMMQSGTVHILVVSGFNVSIVFFLIALFLKLLRLPRKMRIYFSLPLLALYCLITGASNPVVRATIMGMVFLCAYLFKREPDIYLSLSLAALFILGLNPRQLFDVGFQLSFVSVISLVALYPRLRALLKVDNLRAKFIRPLLEAALVSSSAWLGTAGFIAYYFRIFSPVKVLANIFIVPLAALITLSGFTLVIFGCLSPALAWLFAYPCEFLAVLLLHLNALFLEIPGASFVLP